MNIKKMLLLASMAMAAVAFAAPAAAQATVVLKENGTALAKGVEITATSSNLKTTTAAGVLECAKVTLHFEVKTNGPTHVALRQQGAAATKGCVLNRHALGLVPATLPVTVTDGTVGVGEKTELTVNTWGTGISNATFISDLYSPADPTHTTPLSQCDFEGKVHFQGAASGSDVLNVSPSTLTSTVISGNCPPSGTIEGSFTLETPDNPATEVTDEIPVTADFTATG